MEQTSNRPFGIAVSAFLLHVLNLMTVIVIRWGESDSLMLAALFGNYIVFTAIVIHAYWKGQSWARWMVLIRCVWMLASYKMMALEGGFYRAQGVVERVLALVLLFYLNSGGLRAWFKSPIVGP